MNCEKKPCDMCGEVHDEEMGYDQGEDGTGRKSIPIDRVDDLPYPKVKRADGLPTVEDLKALMMGEQEDEPTMGDKVGNMVEIILKLK